MTENQKLNACTNLWAWLQKFRIIIFEINT
jgi:hypothetical protein